MIKKRNSTISIISTSQLNEKFKEPALVIQEEFEVKKKDKLYQIRSEDKESESEKDFDKSNIFKKTFLELVISVFSKLSFFLIDAMNLAFLGRYEDIIDMNTLNLSTVYINAFGFIFCMGALSAFDSISSTLVTTRKNYNKFYKLFHQTKLITCLAYLLVMLPFGFSSNFILSLMKVNPDLVAKSNQLIPFIVVASILKLLNLINYNYLKIFKKMSIVFYLNVFTLAIHLLNLTIFIVSVKLGIMGIGVAMIITSFLSLILSSYFVMKNNMFKGANMVEIDTDCLYSSHFYNFAQTAFAQGILLTIYYIAYDFIIVASSYLDTESMASNVIILNVLGLNMLVMKEFSNILALKVKYYLSNYQKDRTVYSIKVLISLSAIYFILNTTAYLIFNETISTIFINNINVVLNVSYILKIYSIFFVFHFAALMMEGVIQGYEKETEINTLNSLAILIFFIPVGLLLTFSYGLGYLGFWVSNMFSILVFTVVFGTYLYFLVNVKNK